MVLKSFGPVSNCLAGLCIFVAMLEAVEITALDIAKAGIERTEV